MSPALVMVSGLGKAALPRVMPTVSLPLIVLPAMVIPR
jgi:hypothetical protein